MDFRERYNNIQREILELKTAHTSRSNMRTFFKSATIPQMQSFVATTIRLTYADGTQPIMTTTIGTSSLIPLRPSGNTQDFIVAEEIGSLVYEQEAYFLSTRKIESIEVFQ